MRLALILLLLAIASSAASQPSSYETSRLQEVDGPLYPAAHLLNYSLEGVRLGMPFQEASAALLARGYKQQIIDRGGRYQSPEGETSAGAESFYTEGWARSVGISYVLDWKGKPVVSSISFWLKVPNGDTRSPEMWRNEIISQFGKPSYWQKWISEGAIRDEMTYVPMPQLRSRNARAEVDSCSSGNWGCHKLRYDVDCRKVLESAQAPVLEISFVAQSVWFRLEDYKKSYQSLMRSRLFRHQDTSMTSCPIMRIH
jgi:hypothetical protein